MQIFKAENRNARLLMNMEQLRNDAEEQSKTLDEQQRRVDQAQRRLLRLHHQSEQLDKLRASKDRHLVGAKTTLHELRLTLTVSHSLFHFFIPFHC